MEHREPILSSHYMSKELVIIKVLALSFLSMSQLQGKSKIHVNLVREIFTNVS